MARDQGLAGVRDTDFQHPVAEATRVAVALMKFPSQAGPWRSGCCGSPGMPASSG